MTKMQDRRVNGALGALLGLGMLSSVQAGTPDSASSALLAITYNQGRLIAGMMCHGVDRGSFAKARDLPMCRRAEAQSGAICRASTSNILNHDVLAFDVTTWPRQAIAELASQVLQTDDPLNYDFTERDLAGRRVLRVDESQDEGDLASSVFEFSFGCYLLIKIPEPSSVSGT